MFFLPVHGDQYSPGSPQLRCSLVSGQPPRKNEPTGTSFLPTATAWDFSPPLPLPVLPGTRPHPRVLPAAVRLKRRANLSGLEPSHSHSRLTSHPPPPLESPPPFTRVTGSPSSSIPHLCTCPTPKGPVTKIPRNGADLVLLFLFGHISVPSLAVHQIHTSSVKSTAFCTQAD